MPPVGKNVNRQEGLAKVTGVARYIDDYQPADVLYGATVRSQVAKGRLRAIVWDPDFDWSDIVRVTADDIPGLNVVTLIEDDQPALAADRIEHPLEPVAVIACADRDRLREALAHVEVDVEVEEPCFELLESDRVFCELGFEKGDVEAGFAQAAHVVAGEYYVGHQEQMYIEPQGMMAEPLPGGGIRVTGSLQCPYYVHKSLKRLLDLDGDQVEIAQATTGGGFGGKEEYPSMIASHAALAARKSGRTVKIIYGRSEDIGATTKRHPAVVRIRHGARSDGTLTAVEAEVIMDGGAYVTLSKVVLSRAIIHAVGPYRCDNVRVRGRVVATNTPPNGAFRGFGAPQTTFAYERQMDRVAAACGLDPLEVRRRCYVVKGDQTATGQVLGVSVGSTEVLEEGLEISDYVRRRAELDALEQTGSIRRGIGLSFFFHGDGFTGGGDEKMAGEACLDLLPGGRVLIRTGSTEIGQGVRTVFPQIVAQTLGIDLDLVDFEESDTAKVPDSGPTVASRTTMIVGKVLEEAAKELRARVGEAAPGLQWAEGAETYRSAHGPVTVTRQYTGPGGLAWDEDTYRGDAYPCYSWACDVAQVAVNMDTGDVRVERVWLAQDVGKAIHPVMCEGQIEGGTLQGIGYAVMEEVVMKDGRPWNDRMTNYVIPTALDTPPMTTKLVEIPYPHGPFGAKGVGELPMDGIGPAIASAIQHATGVFVDRQPAMPEYLLPLLEARG